MGASRLSRDVFPVENLFPRIAVYDSGQGFSIFFSSTFFSSAICIFTHLYFSFSLSFPSFKRFSFLVEGWRIH